MRLIGATDAEMQASSAIILQVPGLQKKGLLAGLGMKGRFHARDAANEDGE